MDLTKLINKGNGFINHLRDFFKDNLKLFHQTDTTTIMISIDDIFYEMNSFNKTLPSQYSYSNPDNFFEQLIVKKLCNKGIVDLSISLTHYFALTNDHEVFCWGNNHYGQLAYEHLDQNIDDFHAPELNESLSELNFQLIKCGSIHSVGLTTSGDLYAWGGNSFGQIGNNSDTMLDSVGMSYQSKPFKLNFFNKEIIKMISCGFYHSMMLTESGYVYSWGDNSCHQSDFNSDEGTILPEQLNLKRISISKISCGRFHNLLLSKEGDIYAFGDNSCGQCGNGKQEKQSNIFKIEQENKFIDIAAHFSTNISMSLSDDYVYYIWGDCGHENILVPRATEFKSFNEIFMNYFQKTLDISNCFIDLSLFRNGLYKKNFEEIEELGSGSFGSVYKVELKFPTKVFADEGIIFAIKKVKLKEKFDKEFFSEARSALHAIKLDSNFVIKYFGGWFEKCIQDNRVIMFTMMELCDKTLEKFIDEIYDDSELANEGILTQIGYYLASQIFIEILECIQYLHKDNLIHRDLNPNNIMLKRFNHYYNIRFIKIGDFGLMAIHNYAEELHSSEKGTMRYMAPEVDRSKKYDTKADIYSLGMVLKRFFLYDFDE